VELRDLESYGEPGAIVYRADCLELMRLMPPESVDVVFADPPYRLSRGGVSVRSGRLVSVDKGGWDRSLGLEKDLERETSDDPAWLDADSSPTPRCG
jgi:site-specific DNA-methyltransferase (adenine-specific)